MRLLIVDDDVAFAQSLKDALVARSFAVDIAHSREDASHFVDVLDFSAILLDQALASGLGTALLRSWRSAGRLVPVLMVSGCDDVDVRVAALSAGADDFIVKPFVVDELVARINAVVRRHDGHAANVLYFGGLTFNRETRRLSHGDQTIAVSAREADIVEILMHRPGRLITRRLLEDQLFGADGGLGSNAIEVYMYRVRRKLERIPGLSIQTIRGLGYILVGSTADEGASRDHLSLL